MEVTKPSNLKSMTTAVITGMQSNLVNSCRVFSQRGCDKSFLPNVKTDGSVEYGSDESGVVSQVCVCPQAQPSALSRLVMASVLMHTRQHPPTPEGLALPPTVICHEHKHQLCQYKGRTQKNT